MLYEVITELDATLAVDVARVRLPPEAATARADGMSISRTYYRLLEGGRKRIEPGEGVAQGEEVFVELRNNFV